jgi:hypothetical protein
MGPIQAGARRPADGDLKAAEDVARGLRHRLPSSTNLIGWLLRGARTPGASPAARVDASLAQKCCTTCTMGAPHGRCFV